MKDNNQKSITALNSKGNQSKLKYKNCIIFGMEYYGASRTDFRKQERGIQKIHKIELHDTQ